MIKLNCKKCNVEFNKETQEYNTRIKMGQTNFFCSLSCCNSFNRLKKIEKEIETYNLSPKTCKFCNEIIPYKKRNLTSHCNHSCAAKLSNSARCKNIPITKQFCISCKQEIEINNRHVSRKYCNSTCQGNERHNLKLKQIESGNYRVKSNKSYKEYLILKYGHKCQMCSLTEWGGKPMLLILDHIDGNSDNFNLGNLRTICSNCDTLTLTYKGRNRGKGRHFRKQRYKEGKSF